MAYTQAPNCFGVSALAPQTPLLRQLKVEHLYIQSYEQVYPTPNQTQDLLFIRIARLSQLFRLHTNQRLRVTIQPDLTVASTNGDERHQAKYVAILPTVTRHR
jgi:hypothetical protein